MGADKTGRVEPNLSKLIDSKPPFMTVQSKKKIGVLIAAALVGLLCYGWLAFGFYSDREFFGLYVFRKYRLSTRLYFYAPLGESDNPLSSLSPEQQRAEAAYKEFVDDHGGRNRACKIFN